MLHTALMRPGTRSCARHELVAFALLVGFGAALIAAELPPPAPHRVDFDKEVQPIFERTCLKCHGAEKQKSGYRLDDRRVALSGGDNHAPNIVVGKSAESPLIRFVAGLEPDMRMPAKGDALTAIEIGVLRAWIDQGAVWSESGKNASADPFDWWSLRALSPQPVPSVNPTGNPIDAFIRARLARENLRPSPEADARTLIRRIYFDVIGLPPAADETDRFIAEYRSASGERRDTLLAEVVDRLLASPRYGERWARHWLDVVHYGDTHGYDKDKPRPNAWPYRDYVIRALNADKPYARFVEEQIAGDALFPGNEDGIRALGFIAAGPWDFIGHAELPESKIDGKIARLLDRDDMVANTMNTFCALTVQCARCHNHKFDPVKQEDYYRLQAVFAALDRTDRAYDTDPSVARRRSEIQEEKRALSEREQLIQKDYGHKRQASVARVAALEGERAALEKELGRTEGGDGVARELAGELRRIVARLAKLDAELQSLPPPKVVYAGAVHHGSGSFLGTGPNGGKPRPVHVLKRGDVRQPLREVGPGTVPFIPELSSTFDLPPEHSESARRVALARWITDPRNPLTWRVIVNRVWHYHFGRGLVDSPNDFGRMGEQPTHPELLDWLALKFRDEGQSLKELHRLIVTSATYRQSSASIPGFEKHDAGNALLWRMNRRKLEAEAVRDSMLAVAGKLDLTMGGAGFHDFSIEKPEHSPHYRYDLHDANDPRSHRRAIYRFVVRSQPQPFMTVLDCADPSMAVEKRNESVNALQALALRNNAFSIAMAQHFATRVTQTAVDPAHQIEAAFGLALSRSPNQEERVSLSAYAREHGMANTCRLIFNLNEFVFID